MNRMSVALGTARASFLVLWLALVGCTELLLEPAATEEAAATFPAGFVNEPAEVVWVIDGDTIEVEMGGARLRVRYIGVDTPERDELFYQEASDANARLVEGERVLLVKDVSEMDRFGRLLRYVYLEDGTFVNAELVERGYATAVTFPPDVAYVDLFRRLERKAREGKVGLWGGG